MKFARIAAEARGFGLDIVEMDDDRPWGGFVRFHRDSLDAFREAYWERSLPDPWRELLREIWAELETSEVELHLDAKLLLVAPSQRLSLQSHARRSELWRVLEGPLTMVMGPEPDALRDHEVRPGEVIRIPCGTCHRGAAPPRAWAVIAEFWRHENPSHPTDENDIVRYADDYDR